MSGTTNQHSPSGHAAHRSYSFEDGDSGFAEDAIGFATVAGPGLPPIAGYTNGNGDSRKRSRDAYEEDSSSAALGLGLVNDKRVKKARLRPPVNEDIPGHVTDPDMVFCYKMWHRIFCHKLSWPFHKPVDAIALNLPDYHDIVKRPMDLSTVKQRLDSRHYIDAHTFRDDMELIFNNCCLYNKVGSDVVIMCNILKDIFLTQWALLPSGPGQSPDALRARPRKPRRPDPILPAKAIAKSPVSPSTPEAESPGAAGRRRLSRSDRVSDAAEQALLVAPREAFFPATIVALIEAHTDHRWNTTVERETVVVDALNDEVLPSLPSHTDPARCAVELVAVPCVNSQCSKVLEALIRGPLRLCDVSCLSQIEQRGAESRFIRSSQHDLYRLNPHVSHTRRSVIHADACGACGAPGDLVCCDQCPSVFHPACVRLPGVPAGRWQCAVCEDLKHSVPEVFKRPRARHPASTSMNASEPAEHVRQPIFETDAKVVAAVPARTKRAPPRDVVAAAVGTAGAAARVQPKASPPSVNPTIAPLPPVPLAIASAIASDPALPTPDPATPPRAQWRNPRPASPEPLGPQPLGPPALLEEEPDPLFGEPIADPVAPEALGDLDPDLMIADNDEEMILSADPLETAIESLSSGPIDGSAVGQ